MRYCKDLYAYKHCGNCRYKEKLGMQEKPCVKCRFFSKWKSVIRKRKHRLWLFD